MRTWGIDIPGHSRPPMYAIEDLPQNLPSKTLRPPRSLFALAAYQKG